MSLQVRIVCVGVFLSLHVGELCELHGTGV
jgi:hypothetical protein